MAQKRSILWPYQLCSKWGRKAGLTPWAWAWRDHGTIPPQHMGAHTPPHPPTPPPTSFPSPTTSKIKTNWSCIKLLVVLSSCYPSVLKDEDSPQNLFWSLFNTSLSPLQQQVLTSIPSFPCCSFWSLQRHWSQPSTNPDLFYWMTWGDSGTGPWSATALKGNKKKKKKNRTKKSLCLCPPKTHENQLLLIICVAILWAVNTHQVV